MNKVLLSLTILFTSFSWGQSFGTDVIIKTDTVDQENVELAAAFNGWLFAAVSLTDETNNAGGISIRKSTDGGYTWTTVDEYFVNNVRYPTFDLVVTGNDEASLQVFLVGVNHTLSTDSYVIYVDVYNGQTNSFTGSVLNIQHGTSKVYDVEIASDYKAPATVASPFSVGVLYSCFGSTNDSIISLVSLDGGSSFTVRNTVATTASYFRNVSLDYGRSVSASNGRYFAAWEMIPSSTGRVGHIYTSRNASVVSGSWIAPENLDSISSTMINLCRNPRIAVQQNNLDNDSASVTAVVTVDRDYNGDGSDYDVLGFYNKRAHYANYWYRFDINNSGTNDMGADVFYEDSTQLFHVVYFDSTDHQLKYVTNTMNLLSPNSWTSVQNGMNDVPSDTRVPNTRIAFRPGLNELSISWIDNPSGGDGIAKFDTESFASASIDESELQMIITIYPNPATDWLNVQTADQNVMVTIVGMDGAILLKEEKTATEFAIPVEHLASGMYLLRIEQNGKVQQQQFVKR